MTPCYLIVAPLAATISLCAMGFAHADESASVLTEQQAPQNEEYIYKSTTDGRVEVFSLSKKFVYSEGAEYLLRRDGRHRGEFAGQIVICSSNRYQCIRGGVYAVVPAAPAGEEHWSFRGITCSADAPLSRNKGNTVRCTFRGMTTVFSYDVARGIVSYGNNGNNEREFELVGDRGLLASRPASPNL